MEKKILVVYASRSGSTAQASDAIAHELSSIEGVTAEAVSVKSANDITLYDVIVLGTAIRMGRQLPEMISFVKSYLPILRTKKIALFGFCMTLKDDTPANRKIVGAYCNQLTSLISPVDIQLFAGKVNPARLGLLARMAVRMVKAPVGDFRKWEDIKAWARALNSKL